MATLTRASREGPGKQARAEAQNAQARGDSVSTSKPTGSGRPEGPSGRRARGAGSRSGTPAAGVPGAGARGGSGFPGAGFPGGGFPGGAPGGGAGTPGGPAGGPAGAAAADGAAPRKSRAGRNLPAAIAVGLGLLGIVAASLWFRPEPFVAFVVIAMWAALWELRQAFARRDIHLPMLPLMVGAAGMEISAFFSGPQQGPEALLVAFVLTVAGAVVWRALDGSGSAAVRDAAAATFAAAYLPFMAGFVVLMLTQPDGEIRVALFILLAVAGDTGGYIAGVMLGRHPLAPTVSPKKSWEGLAGSVVLATAVGIVGSVVFLKESVLLGVALGVLSAVTALIGDLAESMLKRDLELKDMGTLLPGHGGVLDRLDSLLLTAPFVYLVLSVVA